MRHLRQRWVHVVSFGFATMLGQAIASAEEDTATVREPKTPILFEQDIAPILQSHCVDCHGPSLQMADLRLDSRAAALEAGVIEPGSSQQSLLVGRLHDKELGILMPPTGKLPDETVQKLEAWIDSGAAWPEGIVLAAGAESSASDLTMQSLTSALRSRRTDSLKRLLEDQSVAELRDRRGATPLMYATLYGNLEAVELLLDAGADVNASAEDGATALMWGARSVDVARLLIGRGADVDARSRLGRAALTIAASHAGNADTVRMLLEAGADVNAQDNSRVTPLIVAVATRDTELIQVLLDAGADVHVGEERGYDGAPLTQAAYANDAAAVQMLLSHGAGKQGQAVHLALIYAAVHGSRELAEVLLDAGADPNALVSTGTLPETPLTAAVYSDHQNVGLVQLLLERGADADLPNSRGQSPLEIAKQRGNTQIVALVAEQRARQAAQKSISLLQSCGPTFFSKSGCAACHQQSATSLVLGLARSRGLLIDEQTARVQVKLTSVDLGAKQSQFLQRRRIGGTSHRIAYLLVGLAAETYEADDITDAAVFELAGLQLKDGSWLSDAHRPPSEYSQISATAFAARAIQLFAPPALKDEMDMRLARASTWLVAARPHANEEHAMRLLGLKWLGADQGTIEAACGPLLEQQRENGGWSQLSGLSSDAYATGLTLYALHEGGGIDIDHTAYQRGIEFLLDTQQEDGSWHVRSRSHKFQPYFESGFPHGDDQWISAAGTGWATMALLLTVDLRPERVE